MAPGVATAMMATMARRKPFVMQFPPEQVPELAAAYCYKDDGPAVRAGADARREGAYSKDGLLRVVRWKAARALPLVVINRGETIASATSEALAADDDAVALAQLVELPGIGVPIASTLLHFAYPDRYPILDYRALRSLGHGRRTVYPIAFAVRYFAACRELRNAHDSIPSLRFLDKALWTYDVRRHPPKLRHRRCRECR